MTTGTIYLRTCSVHRNRLFSSHGGREESVLRYAELMCDVLVEPTHCAHNVVSDELGALKASEQLGVEATKATSADVVAEVCENVPVTLLVRTLC